MLGKQHKFTNHSRRQRFSFPIDQQYISIQLYNSKLSIQKYVIDNSKTIYQVQYKNIPENIQYLFNSLQHLYSYLAMNYQSIVITNEQTLQIVISILQESKIVQFKMSSIEVSQEEKLKRILVKMKADEQKMISQQRRYRMRMDQNIQDIKTKIIDNLCEIKIMNQRISLLSKQIQSNQLKSNLSITKQKLTKKQSKTIKTDEKSIIKID